MVRGCDGHAVPSSRGQVRVAAGIDPIISCPGRILGPTGNFGHVRLEARGPIGCGGFRNFEADSAEVSIVIGVPALWAHGFGADALELLLSFGFNDLGLTTIHGDHDAAHGTSDRRRHAGDDVQDPAEADQLRGQDEDRARREASEPVLAR